MILNARRQLFFLIALLSGLGMLQGLSAADSRAWFDQMYASQEKQALSGLEGKAVEKVAGTLIQKVDATFRQKRRQTLTRQTGIDTRKPIYAVLLSVGMKEHSGISHVGFGNSLDHAAEQAYRDWISWLERMRITRSLKDWTDIRLDAVTYIRPLGRLSTGKLLAMEPGVHALALGKSKRIVFSPSEIWAWDVLSQGAYSPINLSKAAQIKATIHSGKLNSKVKAVGSTGQEAFALDLISYGATRSLLSKNKSIAIYPYFRMHPMVEAKTLNETDLIWSARKAAAYIARSLLPDYRPIGFYIPGTSKYLAEDDPATQALTAQALYRLLRTHPNSGVKQRADFIFERLMKKLEPASSVKGVKTASYVYLEETLADPVRMGLTASKYQSAAIYLDTISQLILAWAEKARYSKQRVISDKRFSQLGHWLLAMRINNKQSQKDGQFYPMWRLPQMKMPLGEVELNKRVSERLQNVVLTEDISQSGLNARATLALNTMAQFSRDNRFRKAAEMASLNQHKLVDLWAAHEVGQEAEAERTLRVSLKNQQGQQIGDKVFRPKGLLESHAWQMLLTADTTQSAINQLIQNKTRSHHSVFYQMDWEGGISAEAEAGQSEQSAIRPPTTYATASHQLALARYYNQNSGVMSIEDKLRLKAAIRKSAAFLMQCQLGGERLMHIRKSHGGDGPFVNHLKSKRIDLRTNVICLLAMIEGAEVLSK